MARVVDKIRGILHFINSGTIQAESLVAVFMCCEFRFLFLHVLTKKYDGKMKTSNVSTVNAKACIKEQIQNLIKHM